MKEINEILNNAKDILIVAPHPDDETLGCGGIMLEYGCKTDVLLLTDGRKGVAKETTLNENSIVQIREKELHSATEATRIREVFLLRLPDSQLRYHLKEVKKFQLSKYDCVFVPNRFERHLDHSIVYSTIKKMMHKQKCNGKLFEYEVWTPLRTPSYMLDISHKFDDKQKLVSMYHSQLFDYDYLKLSEGLAKYRGVLFSVEYAEAYNLDESKILRKMFYSLNPAIQIKIRDMFKYK